MRWSFTPVIGPTCVRPLQATPDLMRVVLLDVFLARRMSSYLERYTALDNTQQNHHTRVLLSFLGFASDYGLES